MKLFYICICTVCTLSVLAQSTISKSIPLANGQKIDMHFDYPNLIRVSNWAKNEVSITGTVSINGGESDEAFKLTSTVTDGTLIIEGEIPAIKDLPQRITVKHNGVKMVFKNKKELENYKKEHGAQFEMTSWGHDVDIVLDIKVPLNSTVCIKSIYGFIELKDLTPTMPLTAESTYGGVDAALNSSSVGELFASTDYGEIYTNLDVKFSGEGLKQRDFHTEVNAKPGKGTKYSFESKYGNVYLRKK